MEDLQKTRFKLIKAPIHRYTFSVKSIRNWVESECEGLVLNLFAGQTKLNVFEVRNDLNTAMNADHHFEALEFLTNWSGEKFDTVILDPPYSYRKSMELYEGHSVSKFRLVKDAVVQHLNPNAKVLTFGYQSIVMGYTRGFELEALTVFSHGGAIHDTLCSVERYKKE